MGETARLTSDDLDPADLYVAPTRLAEAIQRPLYPEGSWQQGVLNAYNEYRRILDREVNRSATGSARMRRAKRGRPS